MTAILAFAGSNSSTSINHKLTKHTVSLISGHEIQVLNMANHPFPMYSEDYEKENGYSNALITLRNDIKKADGLIIAVNEHNGGLSAYFKNLLDWMSRLERSFLKDKKILLMSASPGKRGALGALEVVENMLPRFGGEISSTFSLPSFNDNFDLERGIIDEGLSQEHQNTVQTFLKTL